MIEKYAGIPQSTLTNWVTQSEEISALKLPSGKTFRVTQILASDGISYSVVEPINKYGEGSVEGFGCRKSWV
jgi:hypothetical protein